MAAENDIEVYLGRYNEQFGEIISKTHSITDINGNLIGLYNTFSSKTEVMIYFIQYMNNKSNGSRIVTNMCGQLDSLYKIKNDECIAAFGPSSTLARLEILEKKGYDNEKISRMAFYFLNN